MTHRSGYTYTVWRHRSALTCWIRRECDAKVSRSAAASTRFDPTVRWWRGWEGGGRESRRCRTSTSWRIWQRTDGRCPSDRRRRLVVAFGRTTKGIGASFVRSFRYRATRHLRHAFLPPSRVLYHLMLGSRSSSSFVTLQLATLCCTFVSRIGFLSRARDHHMWRAKVPLCSLTASLRFILCAEINEDSFKCSKSSETGWDQTTRFRGNYDTFFYTRCKSLLIPSFKFESWSTGRIKLDSLYLSWILEIKRFRHMLLRIILIFMLSKSEDICHCVNIYYFKTP